MAHVLESSTEDALRTISTQREDNKHHLRQHQPQLLVMNGDHRVKTRNSTSTSSGMPQENVIEAALLSSLSSSDDDDQESQTLHRQPQEQSNKQKSTTLRKGSSSSSSSSDNSADKRARTLIPTPAKRRSSFVPERVLRRQRVMPMAGGSTSPAVAGAKTSNTGINSNGSNRSGAVDFANDGDDELDVDDDVVGKKRTRRETLPDIAKRIPVDALRPYLRMPLLCAAKELGISATTLKRLCRHYGIKRWPFRQISGIDRTVTRLEAELELSMNRASSAEMTNSIAEHIQQLQAHRQSIIKVALEGGHEPIRGKLASVGMFVSNIQSSREAGGANIIPSVQQHHHQQGQLQEQQRQHQRSASSLSSPLSSFMESGGGGNATSSNGIRNGDGEGALLGPHLTHLRHQQRKQEPASNGGSRGGNLGSAISSPTPLHQRQSRGDSALSYSQSHPHHPKRLSETLSSLLDDDGDVPIVTPGANTKDNGTSGSATFYSSSSSSTTPDVVAGAVAAVVMSDKSARSSGIHGNIDGSSRPWNLYQDEPLSPCMVVPRSRHSSRSEEAGDVFLGGIRNVQHQHHQQQLLPQMTSYPASSGVETTTDGGQGGVTPPPSRGWNVVPATPNGGEEFPHHSSHQHPQPQEGQSPWNAHPMEQVQRQSYRRDAENGPNCFGMANQHQAPLPQQHQQPAWSKPLRMLSGVNGDYGADDGRYGSTRSTALPSSQSEFLMAAATAVTNAAAPVQNVRRARHGPKASIDLALDQVSTLGELVLGDYNLYPDATSYDAIDMMDDSTGSTGGSRSTGGGGSSGSGGEYGSDGGNGIDNRMDVQFDKSGLMIPSLP